MKINIEKDNNKSFIVLSDVQLENGCIKLSEIDICDIHNMYDKEVYFREDVKNKIEEMIEWGDLDADKINDEDFINNVLEIYANIRFDHCDGGINEEDFLPWDVCLDMAFKEVL